MAFRTKFPWTVLKSLDDWLSFLIATVLGVGLLPGMPGTFGTIAAVPVVYVSFGWSTPMRVLFWLMLLIIGAWAAQKLNQKLKTADASSVVVDEVLGLGISCAFLGPDLRQIALAFLIFRFFDITKIFPVRQIDRWSKNQALDSRRFLWPLGFGTMLDDVVAGVQACLVIEGLKVFFLWPT